jgi:hypothetical protein
MKQELVNELCKNEDIAEAIDRGWRVPELCEALRELSDTLTYKGVEEPKRILKTIVNGLGYHDTFKLLFWVLIPDSITEPEALAPVLFRFYVPKAEEFLRHLEQDATHVGRTKKLCEALEWLKRTPKSRIANSSRALERNYGIAFVETLYGLGAESVEVDISDEDKIAYHLSVILPEDWEKKVRLIIELAKADPDKVGVLDNRTIRLALSERNT